MFDLTNNLPSIFWYSNSNRTAARDGRKPTWSLSITASWKSQMQVNTFVASDLTISYITIATSSQHETNFWMRLSESFYIVIMTSN